LQLPADVHEPSGLLQPVGQENAHGAIGQPSGGQVASHAQAALQRTPAAQLEVPSQTKLHGPLPHTVEKLQLVPPPQCTSQLGALSQSTRRHERSPVHSIVHAAVSQSMLSPQLRTPLQVIVQALASAQRIGWLQLLSRSQTTAQGMAGGQAMATVGLEMVHTPPGQPPLHSAGQLPASPASAAVASTASCASTAGLASSACAS
jgi:hypothetical protein